MYKGGGAPQLAAVHAIQLYSGYSSLLHAWVNEAAGVQSSLTFRATLTGSGCCSYSGDQHLGTSLLHVESNGDLAWVSFITIVK